MIRVCLITINFNSDTATHNCLESLKQLNKNGMQVEIVVVDNASKVPFVLSPEEKKEGITLMRSEQNLGFTGGNNLGMKYAIEKKFDYVLLLNNDTIVDPLLLKELMRGFDASPKVGLVVPKIYFAKGHEFHKNKYKKEELGNVFWYAGGFVDWANVFTRHRGVDEVDKGQYDMEEKIDFATGCCMLINLTVLRKVGLFDDKYFLYFEDGDLGERIKRAGFNLFYNPKAILWHINAGSSGSGSTLHDYYISRNRMLFGMRYAPLRSKVALIRESLRLLLTGRQWQKKGIQDFYKGRFGKGSFQ